jgi:hypothetical protein
LMNWVKRRIRDHSAPCLTMLAGSGLLPGPQKGSSMALALMKTTTPGQTK